MLLQLGNLEGLLEKHEISESTYRKILREQTSRQIHRRQYYSRVRRQLGGGPFYEYNSDEIESGPWEEWGQPSVCSRTCGGGVQTEERLCGGTRPDQCVGPSRRYSSCNLQECPRDSKDFRAEQCAEHNNKLYERKYYDWIPYLKAPRKCELNCMPKGERFYLMLNKKVVDGTSCDEEGGRVCVDGECKPIGCDGMLGSTIKEDNCRICGGDGSNCDTITDTIDRQDLQMGYNDLFVIPAGATNIRIAEVKASNNYLALRSKSGEYYLNGNWRIDYPQKLDCAGTSFIYERKHKSGKTKGLFTLFAPESIRAMGPTTEPLYVVILYQEENPGIEFEYSMKKDSVKETPVSQSGGYQWTQGAWSECDAPCGGGTRSREVFCSEEATFQRVSDGLCDSNVMPPINETCNADPCRPRYNVGEWGNCTVANETESDCTQYQFRNVFCEQVVANNLPTLVDMDTCLADLGDPPVGVKQCDEEIEDDFLPEDSSGPKYHIGPWSGCSTICGDGVKTREVTCYKKGDETVDVLEDSECSGTKPATEEPCKNESPCELYDWIISDVTPCEGKCGLTQTTKNAICTDKEGNQVDESLCETDLPADLSEDCEQTQPVCEFSWYATQWSPCSSPCSDVQGIQTRSVFCGSMGEDGSISNVTDDNCLDEMKYNETQDCFGNEECTGTWYTSSWDTCSQDCDSGKRNRIVYCIKEGKPVAPDQCQEDLKPFEEQDCNTESCPEASGDGEEPECEYYDDWWIFGKGGNGTVGGDEGMIVEGATSDSPEEDGSGDGSGDKANEIDYSLFSKRCKPKPVEPCSNSTYGCCPDGFYAPIGPFGEGCNEFKTCEDTRYGCCQDGVTVAEGAKFVGCPDTNCEDTLFGCCNDGETPASGYGDDSKCDENKSCKSSKFGCCPDGRTFSQGPNKQGCFTCPEEVFMCDSCEKTEFGCCPDLQNAAAGPEFDGCPDEDGSGMYEDCTLSNFGCCPDGITKAKGENFKGCDNATPCKNAKWGCCDDLLNPAHGPNKEGCCLNSEFGCCPDNTSPAEGPDNKGCGCEFTEFKCCPDDITPARGPDFEGCGCVSTENGCCPDKFTPSPGPDGQGCPCYTYEYGCCPDGETIARGPAQEGCSCKDREYGCCPDRNTPATGPNFDGCGCAASEYGCCPDGNSTALGNNFEGCEEQELPEPPAEVCGLEKDRGPARNFEVKWFFDMEYGGCTRFWYGGEGGNRNRFETKEECDAVCVEPTGKDACNLPIVPGPCEGFYQKYGFNRDTGSCQAFTYGGCLGNNNKFVSQRECQDTCEESEFKLLHTNKCEQPIEEGPCLGNFTRYGFNKEDGKCHEFDYGGCKGNLNSFISIYECFNTCEEGGGSRAMCLLPRSPGPCQDRLPKWYFDNLEKRCMPFYYGGCEGNGNKFDSQEECQKSCPSEFLQGDICQLEKKVGPCRDMVERYFFDSNMGTCQQFLFGGCDGNKNNFLTMEDCEARCSTDYSIPIQEEFKLEFCFEGKDSGKGEAKQPRWYYDHEDGVCKSFIYGGKEGNRNRFLTRQSCEASCFNAQDVCTLPKVLGPCNGNLEQFWYDPEQDNCFSFTYGGCEGNGNRFDTIEFCESRCQQGTGPKRPGNAIAPGIDICSLEMKEGPCTENIPSWSFDLKKGVCTGFTYGGCEGNANRFESEEQCERQCGRFKNQDVCGQARDIGPCYGRFRKFYYDSDDKECLEFTFGGCEGNGNRFSSIKECELVCLSREEPEVEQQSTISKDAICKQPVDMGLSSCKDNLERWYYDSRAKTCSAFIYSGCSGNMNRFKTFEVCMGFCEQTEPNANPVDRYRPPPANVDRPSAVDVPTNGAADPSANNYDEPASTGDVNCDEAEGRCSAMRCPYGTLRYYDDRTKCEGKHSFDNFYEEDFQFACYCNEPCQGFSCPAGTSCKVEPRTARGETIYRAVCRDDTKEGICPKLSRDDEANCNEDCQTDGDCSGEQKCCYNGCGKSCVTAAKDPGMVDYEQETVAPEDPNAPKIEVVSPNIIVNEGDVASLAIRVNGNPKPDVYWRKNNRNVDTMRGRFSILPDGTLQVVGARPEDQGRYDAYADNGRGPPITKPVLLTVNNARELAANIMESNRNIIMSLGAPAVIACRAYGWPRPTVTWWKGTKILPLNSDNIAQEEDFTLRIRTVSLSDLGPYTCQAYNGLGEAASFTVEMKVYGPVSPGPGEEKFLRYVVGTPVAPVTTTTSRPGYRPQRPDGWDYNRRPEPTTANPNRPRPGYITVSVSMPQNRFPVNSHVLIPCDVNSYSRPTISWYKDGDRVRENSRVLMLRHNNTLAIYGAGTNDSGDYTCKASNGYNEAEDTANIVIEDIQVQDDCTDNPYFANCKLIVKARYCGNRYYAKFCCRSCTLAGQIPYSP